MTDRYGRDVLSGDWRARARKVVPEVPADPGLVVEIADGMVGAGYVGEVVGVDKQLVELEDRHGKRRMFPMGNGYLVDGEPAKLVPSRSSASPTATLRTASGSLVAPTSRAKVARGSRILVEGRHDAELVEKIWGDDLRDVGVVVESLDGIDHLADVLRELDPAPGRRVGVLVDHLVPGSKEQRIAESVSNRNMLVVGHPFVDVWQGVKPAALGIRAWPEIARGQDWKHGICAAFGWPHEEQADIARAWQRILGRARSYTDLEPALVGRVEELIDFVTAE